MELVHRLWPGFLRLSIPREDLLDLALACALRLGGPPRQFDAAPYVAMMQTGRASVLREREEYDAALAAAAEAEAAYAGLADLRGQGQATNSTGKTLQAMGRLEQAWECFARARELPTRAEYARAIGLTSYDQAFLAVGLGQFTIALEHYNPARTVLIEQLPAEGLDPDVYDATLAAIGSALEQLAQADQAMTALGSRHGRGTAAEAPGEVLEAAGDRAGRRSGTSWP